MSSNSTQKLTELEECRKLVGLTRWLELAGEAGVPHVSSFQSNPFPLSSFMDALDGKPTPEMDAAVANADRMSNLVGVSYFVRWEDCSPGGVKHLIANRKVDELKRTGAKLVHCVDDPRLIDCAVTDPQHIHVRPWVDILNIGTLVDPSHTFPLEFRVYFGHDGYQGISNYYPQRELSWQCLNEINGWDLTVVIDTVRQYAMDLYEYDYEDARQPMFPVGCTMDFVISRDGQALFLEGGPPHITDGYISAHPCCFAPGEVYGVALRVHEGLLAVGRKVD